MTYSVELEGVSEKLSCNIVISSLNHLPPYLLPKAKHIPPDTELSDGAQVYSSIARCIAIIDRPISFTAASSTAESSSPDPLSTDDQTSPYEGLIRKDIDTAVLIFPPSSLPTGSTTTAVHVLITGEGSMSTPSGKCTFSYVMDDVHA